MKLPFKLTAKLLLIIMTVVTSALLLKCGILPKSSTDDSSGDASQYVPSDWDGLTDYGNSDWTVND